MSVKRSLTVYSLCGRGKRNIGSSRAMPSREEDMRAFSTSVAVIATVIFFFAHVLRRLMLILPTLFVYILKVLEISVMGL